MDISMSCHGMPCLKIINPTAAQRAAIYQIMRAKQIGTEEYQVAKQSGAFLQSDYEDFILIEFWLPTGHQEFLSLFQSKVDISGRKAK